jgi:DNA-directed RNA polymerase specialized sigma24 family protein
MVESESALLQRFVDSRDARAFAEIVRRYAGPVYGACLRVLADTDQAADATQETFFQLVRKAGKVRGSLGDRASRHPGDRRPPTRRAGRPTRL